MKLSNLWKFWSICERVGHRDYGVEAIMYTTLSDRLMNRPSTMPVWMPIDMLISEAYKSLSGSAGKALPYFRVHGTCTQFRFTDEEIRLLKFEKAEWLDIVNELLEKGFIDIIDGVGDIQVSDRWLKWGTCAYIAPGFDASEYVPCYEKRCKKLKELYDK